MIDEDKSIKYTMRFFFDVHSLPGMPPSTTRNFAGASDLFRRWLVHSPPHGIRRLSLATTSIGRLFWAYIFWVFTIFMSTFIYSAIAKYIDNPTRIHLSIKQDSQPADYPAITFCNINALEDETFLDDVRKYQLSNGHSPNASEYRKIVSAYADRILGVEVNGQSRAFAQRGHRVNDLLIRCIFNRRLCYRNLTQLFHPTFGNCYTFDNVHHVQTEETNDIPHYWSRDDFDDDNGYKLLLELFLHQPEYKCSTDNRAAFRLFIHRKQEVPILSQHSVLVGPSRYTKLSFSQRIMSLSRECRTELTDSMQQIFRGHQVRYTQALCYKLCEQRFIERRCQCIEPTLAVFYQFFSHMNDTPIISNMSLCSIDNPCLASNVSFDSRKRCAECLSECEIVQYSIQSSHASYPNTKAYKNVYQRVREHFRREQRSSSYLNASQGSANSMYSILRDNLVAIEITASSYPTELLLESPVYTWIDLISSIGGQTGLWIGISLIGLVEIIELLCQVLSRFYASLCPVE